MVARCFPASLSCREQRLAKAMGSSPISVVSFWAFVGLGRCVFGSGGGRRGVRSEDEEIPGPLFSHRLSAQNCSVCMNLVFKVCLPVGPDTRYKYTFELLFFVLEELLLR